MHARIGETRRDFYSELLLPGDLFYGNVAPCLRVL